MCAICLPQKISFVSLTSHLCFWGWRLWVSHMDHFKELHTWHALDFSTCSTWVHKKGINHDYGLQNIPRMGLFFLGILDLLCPMVHWNPYVDFNNTYIGYYKKLTWFIESLLHTNIRCLFFTACFPKSKHTFWCCLFIPSSIRRGKWLLWIWAYVVTLLTRIPTFEWYMTSFVVKNVNLKKAHVKVRLDSVVEHHQSFQVQFSTRLGGPTRMFKEEENFHFGVFWLLHLNFDCGTWNEIFEICNCYLDEVFLGLIQSPRFSCEVGWHILFAP